MAASLWSGIEALFGIQSELRFRLAALIACQLEPRGHARRDCYKAILKMYDVRSKAVHGSALQADALEAHIRDTRVLLSQLICRFTETGKAPTPDELESSLFT